MVEKQPRKESAIIAATTGIKLPAPLTKFDI